MIQQKLKLSNELNLALKDCEEIWIAVAMISDRGFGFIQEHISKTAKQNYLVGIGLPTSPNVLRQLKDFNKNGLFDSRIHHKPNEFFHPKVYLVKSNNKLIAFVGSGNCTEGGFDKNIELSVKTDDQEFCNNLLKWFNALFKHSKTITEDFLQSYQILFNNRTERLKKDKQESIAIFPEDNSLVNLDAIDFTYQFFKKQHYQAFEGNKPWNTSAEVDEERKKVRSQLYKLNDKVLPKFKSKNWDLSEHYVFDDVVSSAVHNHYTSKELDGIWLHYGRDKKQIKAYGEDQTPLDYMRLQVIIHNDGVGIWNRIGKDKGSKIDRDNLRKKLMEDQDYREKLYNIIGKLPDDFYIRLNEEMKYVREFKSEQQLTDFLLKDDYRYYFILGIEFAPNDNKLSEKNITDTVINNFELLYPSYELIKHDLGF